jgi:aminoglycoside phosphotransferase
MPRPRYHVFQRPPAGAEEPLAAVEPVVGTVSTLFGNDARAQYWFGRTDRHFVYLAGDRAGRERVALEAARLRWAAEQGLPVPPLVSWSEDGAWVVTVRVPDDPPIGSAYVRAAVEAARRLSELPPPPPEILAGTPSRRAPARGRLRRAARLAAGGIDPREFSRVRALALSLPADRLAHGDYQIGNVLHDREAGAVHLTDFEFLGPAPAGTDVLLLWQTLDRDADRDEALESLLEGTGPQERERLAILHRWIALRTLAEALVLPPGEPEREGIGECRRLVRLAREHAASWSRA